MALPLNNHHMTTREIYHEKPYRIGTYGTRGVSEAIFSVCLMSDKDGACELS